MSQTEIPKVTIKMGSGGGGGGGGGVWAGRLRWAGLLVLAAAYLYLLTLIRHLYFTHQRRPHVRAVELKTEELMLEMHALDRDLATKLAAFREPPSA